MHQRIYHSLTEKKNKGRKSFAVLVDPDKVDAGMVELPSALPLHQDGKAPIVAIATQARSPRLPGVQTFIEAGLPNFTAGSYGGVLAPAATPAEVIAKLHAALAAVLDEAATQSRISEVGAILSSPEHRTPDGFARFLRDELANARRAARLAGRGRTPPAVAAASALQHSLMHTPLHPSTP
jgi:tripartite-type tricarboxylate transporter receptor subunit TctC